MKKYPRIIRNRTGHIFRKTCQICGKRTDYAVEIEWWQMRGDDSVIKMCKDCQIKLKDNDILQLAEDIK